MLYNKVYTDYDRFLYEPWDARIRNELAPAMYGRKIHRSTVQSAALLAAVVELVPNFESHILGAGSYEDLVIESLKSLNYRCTDVDPVLNSDLRTWMLKNPGAQFDAVVSTSVIEHTTNDEEFLSDSCSLLKPGGYGFFSMDFCEAWDGGALPPTSLRFYKQYDLEVRLKNVIEMHNCRLVGDFNWSEADDFKYAGFTYGFAGFVFRKRFN